MVSSSLIRYASFALFLTGCSSHRFYPSAPAAAPVAYARSQSSGGDFSVTRGLTYREFPESASPLKGDLYLPSGPGPFATVLVVHGGGWNGRDRSDMERISKKLAQNGYAAFNVDYRLAPAFLYPAPIEDLAVAVHWLRKNSTRFALDPSRIGAFGYSAGAHLVAQLALGDYGKDAEVRAVVAGGLPADLVSFKNSPLVKIFLGTTIEAAPQLFAEASPLYRVANPAHRPPFFLYHGTWDRVVPISQMESFRDAALRAGLRLETYEIPGFGHILTFALAEGAVDRGIEFLNRNL